MNGGGAEHPRSEGRSFPSPRVLKLCIGARSLPGQILPEPSNGLNFASHRVSFGLCYNVERLLHACPETIY